MIHISLKSVECRAGRCLDLCGLFDLLFFFESQNCQTTGMTFASTAPPCFCFARPQSVIIHMKMKFQ